MNIYTDESNSNNTKIKKIDKLLSKLPNSFVSQIIAVTSVALAYGV